MNTICNSYVSDFETRYTYDRFTGICDGSYTVPVGKCLGTREKDICYCQGDKRNCTFYPEKKYKYTNRDWLNSLNNKELADWLHDNYLVYARLSEGDIIKTTIGIESLKKNFNNSLEGIKMWLDSEYID